MSYNYTNYIRNNVIRSVVDDLVTNPQSSIQVVEDDQGRTWSLTNGQSFGLEDSGKTSLLERIRNAVVLFFKYLNSTFRSNFNRAIQAINLADQNKIINEIEDSDDEKLYSDSEEIEEDSYFVHPAGSAPSQKLSKDVILNRLMPMMSFADCAAMAGVCRKWNEIIQPKLDNEFLSQVVFGKKQWEQIPGVTDVGDEPKLTEDQKARLISRFKGLCPFFNKPDAIRPHRFQNSEIKKVWQTFRIILIPEKINGEPVDINRVGQVFSFERTENYNFNVVIDQVWRRNGIVRDYNWTVFANIIGEQNTDFRAEKEGRGYFLIVTLDIIPGSRDTTHNAKEKLLQLKGFRVPTPLEAVISNLVLNLEPSQVGKGYFFGDSTFTATDKLFGQRGYNICVGGSSPRGPEVNLVSSKLVGVAAVAEVV